MMQLQEQLKKFLSNISLMRSQGREPDWEFSCYEEIYLKYAIFMEPREVPDKLRGVPRHCYYNCHQILKNKKYRDLVYAEGYAIASDVPFPVSHAWLMDSNGFALDPTWESPGLIYFGIPLSNQWVKSFLKTRSTDCDLSIFTGNYLEKFSLLKEGLPLKAIVKLEKNENNN